MDQNKQTRKPDDAITDDEIRIVGSRVQFSAETMNDVLRDQKREETDECVSLPRKKHVGWLVFIVLAVLAVILFVVWMFVSRDAKGKEDVPSSPEETLVVRDTCYEETLDRVEETKDVEDYKVICSDTIVNDIPLRIYCCKGGHIELSMERPHTDDATILLAAQAADVRNDIDAPTGAFVYHGELISKGHSKLGFCSIVDSQITIGYARETPEYEHAIEGDGDFFRQYALVCDSAIIKIPVKGKALRRALCMKSGEMYIVECTDRESYHDFSQALLDMGCHNALALVGGEGLLFYRDPESSQLILKGTPNDKHIKSQNYIVWRKCIT